MKKLVPLILLALIAGGAWFLSAKRTEQTVENMPAPAPSTEHGGAKSVDGDNTSLPIVEGEEGPMSPADDSEGTVDVEVQPAAKVYKNAEEALAAIKKGASDYDDAVLEQFTEPGEDCTWCSEFYRGVKDLLMQPGTPADQLSYYAEIMAISGKTENIQALVDGIKNPPSQEAADAFAEALELSVGKDPVVHFLADQLSSPNERLKEASVAAITNQGTRLAAEVLYKNTVERGDPDGYYNIGIGLGELVPEDEALPYLQELATKRDQYSHLAVKALLNSGTNGLKLVMDVLATSKDPEADRAMLKDAVDHVSYEEQSEEYLKKVVQESKQPSQVDFANKILEAFRAEAAGGIDGTPAEGDSSSEAAQ